MPQNRANSTFKPRTATRILVVVALAVIAYATIRSSSSPTDEFPVAEFGAVLEATNSQFAGLDLAGGGPKPATGQQRDFDYFPDHYVNQANKPAEQVDAF